MTEPDAACVIASKVCEADALITPKTTDVATCDRGSSVCEPVTLSITTADADWVACASVCEPDAFTAPVAFAVATCVIVASV
jgi:hypothetical protein